MLIDDKLHDDLDEGATSVEERTENATATVEGIEVVVEKSVFNLGVVVEEIQNVKQEVIVHERDINQDEKTKEIATENECLLNYYSEEKDGWKNYGNKRMKIGTKHGKKYVVTEVDNKEKKDKVKISQNLFLLKA